MSVYFSFTVPDLYPYGEQSDVETPHQSPALRCSHLSNRQGQHPLHLSTPACIIFLCKIIFFPHRLGPWWQFSQSETNASCFLVEKPASVSCTWPPVWTTTHSLLVNPDFLFQHMASWHPKLILSLFLTCITFRTDIELPTLNAGAKKRFLPLFQEEMFYLEIYIFVPPFCQ